MTSFDKILTKIDTFFEGKKSSETSLLFLMLFLVIGFFSYAYLFPVTEKMLLKTQRLSREMEKKLLDEKNYLKSVSRDEDELYLVKKAKQEIENSKIILERTTYNNAYIDTKLKELSYLLFNDENWANFLHSITRLAQEHSVSIRVIGNKINEPSIQKIEQILNLKVEFNGPFANTMKFINAIEESELVVDIYEFSCEGKRTIEGVMNIAVWGMKY